MTKAAAATPIDHVTSAVRNHPRMSVGVPVVLVGLVAGGAMTASAMRRPDYVRQCTDPATGRRVPDDECRSGGAGGHGAGRWLYTRGGGYVGIGDKVEGGTTTKPSQGRIVDPGSSTRGSVKRVGFGFHGSSGG